MCDYYLKENNNNTLPILCLLDLPFFTDRVCVCGTTMGGRFEIEVGKTSIGADISWLSQFEGEKEFCYAPLTHLQLVGTPRLEQHNGKTLSIVRLRLTVNQRSKTV